ncbi:hypothetical protein F2Q69_00057763 [Brassica cretica]|uniref:Uncharacterized protein n=1 Tax=Brassica cretica TaxID=69181 RepID=A0A8S9N3B7_BRACR|nr:hypothetical protein F2Q69_00057763 [Brassica cretica]
MASLLTWVGVIIPPHRPFEGYAFVVDEAMVIQEGNSCWIHGLVKHFNYLLRVRGLIHQHGVCFFMIVSRMFNLSADNSLPLLLMAKPALQYGLPLSGLIPYPNLGPTVPQPKFAVRNMHVYKIAQYRTHTKFEIALINTMKFSAVAIGLYDYQSLSLPALPNVSHFSSSSSSCLDFLFQLYNFLFVSRSSLLEDGTAFIQLQDTRIYNNHDFVYLQLQRRSIKHFVLHLSPFRV